MGRYGQRGGKKFASAGARFFCAVHVCFGRRCKVRSALAGAQNLAACFGRRAKFCGTLRPVPPARHSRRRAPPHELTYLPAGKTARGVKVNLKAQDFEMWDQDRNEYVVEASTYTLMVGQYVSDPKMASLQLAVEH